MSDDLRKLIEAVENGTLDAQMCGKFGATIGPYCNGDTITLTTPLNAFNGSLDAAIALCEALLPGWNWARINDRMAVELNGSVYSARGPSPARALLLAVLRAKLMEMENET